MFYSSHLANFQPKYELFEVENQGEPNSLNDAMRNSDSDHGQNDHLNKMTHGPNQDKNEASSESAPSNSGSDHGQNDNLNKMTHGPNQDDNQASSQSAFIQDDPVSDSVDDQNESEHFDDPSNSDVSVISSNNEFVLNFDQKVNEIASDIFQIGDLDDELLSNFADQSEIGSNMNEIGSEKILSQKTFSSSGYTRRINADQDYLSKNLGDDNKMCIINVSDESCCCFCRLYVDETISHKLTKSINN